MENRITVTLTMSADEYMALAEVLDDVAHVLDTASTLGVSQQQENVITAFLRVCESMTMSTKDSA